MKYKVSLFFLALAVAAYFLFFRATATDSYESLTLALDHLCGPGQWSAQSHEASSGGLVVKGLSLNLPPRWSGRPDGRPGVLTLEEVFVKKLLPRSRMEKLLSLAAWQDQPETALAGTVRLKGFRHQAPWGDGEFEGRIGELNAEAVKLAKAGPAGSAAGPAGSAAGPAGFLKALRLDAAGYKKLHLTLKAPEAEAVTTVESASLGGLDFSGDIPPELAKLLDDGLGPDRAGHLKVLGGLSFKSLKAAGLMLDFFGRAPESQLLGSLSLAALEETDVQPFKSVGAFKLTDLQSRLTDVEGRAMFSFNLAGFSFRGLDLADYVAKLMTGLAEAKGRAATAEDLLTSQSTLADFFVSPVSLEEMALTGLELDFSGLASIKLAEMKGTGPYRTGEIPASTKSWLKGLEINLSGASQAGPGREIFEFSRKLGRSHFALEAEAESAYEAKTGSWTSRLSRLSARDLFDLSLSLTWGGLTSDRLEKFKNIPLSAIWLAALNPGELLGEASFNAFNLKYKDQGLMEAIFNFMAAEEGGRVTGAELKERAMAQAGLVFMVAGAQYLKNIEALSQPLLDFLKAPGSLEIDLKSTPPLTFKSASDREPSAVLDALNITFSVNGQPGSPLRFTPGLGGSDPGESDEDDGLE